MTTALGRWPGAFSPARPDPSVADGDVRQTKNGPALGGYGAQATMKALTARMTRLLSNCAAR
nr:hypothetical protein OG409_00460 [Streptomyces sp. NBC_00974]WSX54273.1 hypothetical protein OG409_38455 [Streptomyces sp. NBC_00974]